MYAWPTAACQKTCHFVLREELSTFKDVKSVDRSGDVYENKGSQYIMPETPKVRVSENSAISQNLVTFRGQITVSGKLFYGLCRKGEDMINAYSAILNTREVSNDH